MLCMICFAIQEICLKATRGLGRKGIEWEWAGTGQWDSPVLEMKTAHKVSVTWSFYSALKGEGRCDGHREPYKDI